MLEPQRASKGIRPLHAVVVLGTVALCVIVAFAALSFIAGAIALVVKLAVVFAIVFVVARFVLRRAHS